MHTTFSFSFSVLCCSTVSGFVHMGGGVLEDDIGTFLGGGGVVVFWFVVILSLILFDAFSLVVHSGSCFLLWHFVVLFVHRDFLGFKSCPCTCCGCAILFRWSWITCPGTVPVDYWRINYIIL